MKLSIKATVNKEIKEKAEFWSGLDPLNDTGTRMLAIRRGIFTDFYAFPGDDHFDSIGEVQKAVFKKGVLTVFLDLEVSS